MFAPASAAIRAFGVPMSEIVLLIRSRDVPHFPFAVVIDEVGFVDTSVLPRFMGSEHRFGLIPPLISVPPQKADSVRPPKVVRGARVVDALDPFAFAGIPSLHIGGTVSSAVAAPLLATAPSANGASSRAGLRVGVQPAGARGAGSGSDAL